MSLTSEQKDLLGARIAQYLSYGKTSRNPLYKGDEGYKRWVNTKISGLHEALDIIGRSVDADQVFLIDNVVVDWERNSKSHLANNMQSFFEMVVRPVIGEKVTFDSVKEVFNATLHEFGRVANRGIAPDLEADAMNTPPPRPTAPKPKEESLTREEIFANPFDLEKQAFEESKKDPFKWALEEFDDEEVSKEDEYIEVAGIGAAAATSATQSVPSSPESQRNSPPTPPTKHTPGAPAKVATTPLNDSKGRAGPEQH